MVEFAQYCWLQVQDCANVSLVLNKTSMAGIAGYGYGYGYGYGSSAYFGPRFSGYDAVVRKP